MVEILVALVISLFLVAGVIQLFVGLKQTYRFHEALSRIQENGRFALEMLSRDIRSTGYYGCLSGSGVFDNTLKNSKINFLWNFQPPTTLTGCPPSTTNDSCPATLSPSNVPDAVRGFEATSTNTWTPALDASVTSPASGSDVITLRRGVDGPGVPVLAHGGGNNNMTIPTNSGFQAGDILLVSNCNAASIFQVTSVITGPPEQLVHATTGQTPGNSRATLVDDYANGGLISRAAVSTVTYYIRAGASGIPALWRRDGAANPQELVEGVEQMQILYGVCTGQGASRSVDPATGYVPADSVANWSNVCSVRVNLLLASVNSLEGPFAGSNFTTASQSVIFPPDTGSVTSATLVTPTDRRLRQAFSTTVGIRNRLP